LYDSKFVILKTFQLSLFSFVYSRLYCCIWYVYLSYGEVGSVILNIYCSTFCEIREIFRSWNKWHPGRGSVRSGTLLYRLGFETVLKDGGVTYRDYWHFCVLDLCFVSGVPRRQPHSRL